MADYRQLRPLILKYEGGFVNDPNDLGGATNKGVTFATFKAYCKSHGLKSPTIQDLKNISDTAWNAIFKTMYWDKWKADEIRNQSVANMLVDWYWCSGSYGIKIPQSVLGLTVDGIVGEKTIAAVNSKVPKYLFAKLRQARLDFIDRICKSRPQNKKYRNGWIIRINGIKFKE